MNKLLAAILVACLAVSALQADTYPVERSPVIYCPQPSADCVDSDYRELIVEYAYYDACAVNSEDCGTSYFTLVSDWGLDRFWRYTVTVSPSGGYVTSVSLYSAGFIVVNRCEFLADGTLKCWGEPIGQDPH